MRSRQMIRVLHIFYEMANGGIEHFVMNYYRHIDRSKVQFDFLVSVETSGPFDDEIKSLGGKIYHAYPLKKNPIKNFFDIAHIVQKNGYSIVHRHTGSAFGYYELRAAKRGGAKRLILHAHNNSAGNPLLHYICKWVLPIKCEKLACSRAAGIWLFGQNQSVHLIGNAIECEKFRFSEDVRNAVRAEFSIQNKLVIGHVGRFENQKNHKRLLKIFKQLTTKTSQECVLICVGSGSLKEEVEREAVLLGIREQVLFLGARTDINRLMQIFDVFVLPSLYEGFPIVLVEAQTSGLPCVVSNFVPEECNVSGNVRFCQLESLDEVWAETIIKSSQLPINRDSYAGKMKQAGFDIAKCAEYLCKYYQGAEN